MRKSVVIRVQEELEARPIAHLVQMASGYNSRIYLEVNQMRVNAKSIMGMMSLALLQGETVVLDVEGEDEEAAITALESFFAG